MNNRGSLSGRSAAIALAFSCIALSSIGHSSVAAFTGTYSIDGHGSDGDRDDRDRDDRDSDRDRDSDNWGRGDWNSKIDRSCASAQSTHYRPPSRPASLPKEIPRPGPDVLYWPLATSSQLDNTCVWRADPILISGTSAYRKGEFLYQDFLYDDTALAYPAAATLASNAADIVEVRVKLLHDALAIRITYNTMLDPEATATTIALGSSSVARAIPHNAGARMPAEFFVTAHGNSGDIVNAATGEVLRVRPTVVTDLERRQVHVSVPFAGFQPSKRPTLRLGVAAGLWDKAQSQYLRPSANLPAFYNVAFRYTEPRAPAYPGNWRATSQNAALANGGDLSAFFANISLLGLVAGVSDDMIDRPGGVPSSGLMSRILVSHFETAQGRGKEDFLASLRPESCSSQPCIPTYAGRLQPYDVYIPEQAPPPGGYGLSWVIHGAGGNYNSEVQMTPLAQQSPEFIFFTPEARGPFYWYYGQAGADAFEVWADIAARYRLNPERTAIYGTSMGGYGTLKIASQYPDLFGRAHPVIPCHWASVGPAPQYEASEILPMAASFRNVPVMATYGDADTTCEARMFERITDEWDRLGYRYETHMYPGDHGGAFASSTKPPVLVQSSKWLAQSVVDRNPPHVTFSMNAEMSQPDSGLSNDRAYWVSNLKVRNEQALSPVGTIDVFSFGFGRTDPPASATEMGTRVTEGQTPPDPYILRRKVWGDAGHARAQDRLKITAVNIRELTIHTSRARVSCDAALDVQSDGPLKVTLTGPNCHRQARFQ